MKHIYLILTISFFTALNRSAASDQPPRLLRSSVPVAHRQVYNSECVICQCNIDILGLRKHTLLSCCHMFHRTCLARWRIHAGTCPICKVSFRQNLITINGFDPSNIEIAFLLGINNFLEEQARIHSELTTFLQEEFDSVSGLITLLAVCVLILQNRLNDALRIARLTNNEDFVDYVINKGADRLTHQESGEITVAVEFEAGQAVIKYQF